MNHRRNILIALSMALACMAFAGSARAWHSDIVECYFYVLEQCAPENNADWCLDFGFDDCDDTYSDSIREVTPAGVMLRTGKTVELEAARKRSAGRLQSALAKRKPAPATSPVYGWASEARRKLGRDSHAKWSDLWIDLGPHHKPGAGQQAQVKRLLDQGQALFQQVEATRGRIDFDQALDFQRRMKTLVQGLDDLSFGGPAGSGIAGCMHDCDTTYPGTGNGNGWNRSLCKIACLIHAGDNG